jgi:predicted nucleic acid-binding protein
MGAGGVEADRPAHVSRAKTRGSARGLTLDSGALIKLESGDEYVRALLASAMKAGSPLAVPTGVIAQTWRGGPRMARIARLLGDETVEIVDLDAPVAKAVGLLSARCGHPDIVDISVALCAAERGHAIVTTDPEDLTTVNPNLELVQIPGPADATRSHTARRTRRKPKT